MYDFSGAIHLHTTASDGGQDLNDVLRVADEVGVDFIVLGDHNAIDPRHASLTSRVQLVPGIEYTPEYKVEYDPAGEPVGYDSGPNHLLGIGISNPGTEDFDDPQANIDSVNKLGGLSILAHPADFWLPWKAWQVQRYAGIEIWTYLSDWAEANMKHSDLKDAYGNPDSALTGPRKRVLERWDAEGQKRRVLGMGSMDSHSKMQTVQGESLLVFPLQKELYALRTHVNLSGPLAKDRHKAAEQILSSLGTGRCYIALDSLADASGFQFWLNWDDRRFDMGAEVEVTTVSSDGAFQIRLPHPASVSLIADGVSVYDAEGSRFEISTPIQPGVYRVEVKIDGRHWILSNPIYLRGRS